MDRENWYHTLLKLSKLESVDNGDLVAAFGEVTEALTLGLGIERASIWFYGPNEDSIICQDLYQVSSKTHTLGIELFEKDFPAYFKYLAEERTLPANDARTNPSTKEFTESYLIPNNIFSMLDAPIRLHGKTIGVICNESVGAFRNWTSTDELFAGNVSDIISRALMARERINALKAMEEMNQNLETLVEKRTLELEEQRSRAAYASKMASLGEMAGSIAHEINNPLAIILGLAYEAKKREETGTLDSESLSRILSNIQDTSLRMEKIVKGLRFFAREGSLDEKTYVSVLSVVEDTVALCQTKLVGKDVTLNLKIPPDLKIYCHPVGISLAVLNILSNAMDAVEDSEIKVIEILAEGNDKSVSIRISDSGPGVSSELRDKIMQPFFTTKPVGKGTGLGLSIVKGIIEQHKGTFDLDSKNRQTSFIMKIPNK
jgi:signal transduction histidine kinase